MHCFRYIDIWICIEIKIYQHDYVNIRKCSLHVHLQYGDKKETKYKPHDDYEKDSDYKHKSDKYDDEYDHKRVHKYEDDGEDMIIIE